jgi:hypothetical protein
MTTTRRSSPDDPRSTNIPLFLITLPRSEKSQEIFRLPSLCHICIKVEMYKARNGLTQCHNCQQYAHAWANCKQAPCCLWCGGGNLHKECPEDNAASTPACYNCELAEGEKPHPANYRGCSHTKEELQRKRPQKTPKPQGRCSPPPSPLQACPSLQHSEVANSNNSPRHLRHLPYSRSRVPRPLHHSAGRAAFQGRQE